MFGRRKTRHPVDELVRCPPKLDTRGPAVSRRIGPAGRRRGEGSIVRPRLDRILLLTEVPYLPPGTLRELLMRPWPEEDFPKESRLSDLQIAEEQILETLRILKIESIATRFGGLDKRQHWENTLPLDQQQLLVVAQTHLAQRIV